MPCFCECVFGGNLIRVLTSFSCRERAYRRTNALCAHIKSCDLVQPPTVRRLLAYVTLDGRQYGCIDGPGGKDEKYN